MAELHCHIIGTLSRCRLVDLAANGHDIHIDPSALPPTLRRAGIADFEKWMSALRPWMSAPWRSYLPVAIAHGKDLLNQCVRYSEISFSRLIFSKDAETGASEFAQFHEQVSAKLGSRILVRWLWTFPKWLAREALEAEFDTLRHFARNRGLVGVTFVGTRGSLSRQQHGSTVRQAKELGLGVTAHVGEFGDKSEVEEALRLGIERFGHGLAAFEDSSLLKKCARAGVHFEFCPSSNLATGAIRSLYVHPIELAVSEGISCGVNSDDPGIFGCSVNSEYELVRQTLNLSDQHLAAIACWTKAAAFDWRSR